MDHDVFISYSHHDKPQADAVCAALEAKGIRCWIAPRDVIPGQEWGGAIIEAIRSARVMVLVFSSHANASPQIRREVERAVSAETVLIPFRIEDVAPAQSLEFFLGTPHWLDALTPPFEAHLVRLATAVESFLTTPGEPRRSGQTSQESSDTPVTPERKEAFALSAKKPLLQRLSRRSKITIAASAIALIAIIAVVITTESRPSSPAGIGSSTTTTTAPLTSAQSRLLGLVASYNNCTPTKASIGIAEVQCNGGSSAFNQLYFTLFADQPSLDRAIADPHDWVGVSPRSFGTCPGTGEPPGPHDWHRATDPQQSAGKVACVINPYGVRWTVDSDLLLGEAASWSGDLSAIYQWWEAGTR